MAKSKMENKKVFVGLLLTSLLFLSVVPYFKVSAQTCDPDALRPVSYGQRGAAVKNVQACLIDAGYNISAGATGYYGKQTQQAVTAFYADWYGKWHGRSLGPRGVQELKNLVAGTVPGRGEEQPPAETQQPSTGVSNETLMQALMLILAGKTNEAMALLQGAGLQLPLPTSTVTTTVTTTTPTFDLGMAEGNLTVEKNTTPPDQQTLREGETADVLGIRFRATQGNVLVQRIRVNWPLNVDAPFRVLSRVALVDASGNTLWSSDVTPNEGQPFYRETNGQYYLLITGLNIQVPKDQTVVVYLKATAVSTYPSFSGSGQVTLTVPENGVRALTGANVNLFAPDTSFDNSFVRQTTIAGSAQLSVVRTSDTPLERNVVANEYSGTGTGTAAVMRLTQDLPLLKVRLTAQNDSLRLREVVFTYSASGTATPTPTNFYFEVGGRRVGSVNINGATVTVSNIYTDNVVINRDQSVEAVIGVSRVDNVQYAGGNLSVTLSSVSAENSLGTVIGQPSLNINSHPVHLYAVAPTYQFSASASRSFPQSATSSSNFSAVITVTVPNNVHSGGQVRISSSSPFALQYEFQATSSTSSVSYVLQSVRDANGVVQSQTDGYYVLNAGDTFRFEITAGVQPAHSSPFRVRVNSITWSAGNSGTFVSPVSDTYMSPVFVSDWSN